MSQTRALGDLIEHIEDMDTRNPGRLMVESIPLHKGDVPFEFKDLTPQQQFAVRMWGSPDDAGYHRGDSIYFQIRFPVSYIDEGQIKQVAQDGVFVNYWMKDKIVFVRTTRDQQAWFVAKINARKSGTSGRW